MYLIQKDFLVMIPASTLIQFFFLIFHEHFVNKIADQSLLYYVVVVPIYLLNLCSYRGHLNPVSCNISENKIKYAVSHPNFWIVLIPSKSGCPSTGNRLRIAQI